MNKKLTAILKDLRHGFEARYGERLVRMVLFGSQARGDAAPESDIDVLVVLHGPVNPGEEIARTGELTASLSLKHDVVISRVFVSRPLPPSLPRRYFGSRLRTSPPTDGNRCGLLPRCSKYPVKSPGKLCRLSSRRAQQLRTSKGNLTLTARGL
jgi:uncharacterized protein